MQFVLLHHGLCFLAPSRLKISNKRTVSFSSRQRHVKTPPEKKKATTKRSEQKQPQDSYYSLSGRFIPVRKKKEKNSEDLSLSAPHEDRTTSLMHHTTTNVTNNSTATPIATVFVPIKNETNTIAADVTSKKTMATTEATKQQPALGIFSTWNYQPKHQQSKTVTAPSSKASPTFHFGTKSENDPLTLGDLEELLRANGYVRESDLHQLRLQQLSADDEPISPTRSSMSKAVITQTATTSKSGTVAFPQASLLSYHDLTIGSTVSAGFLGMLLATTIFPNLWLAGLLGGCYYGYEVSKDYATNPPTNSLAKLVVGMGRRLAKFYLKVNDAIQSMWFLYKTGQLSYEYYKTYSRLDERYDITTKVDAWNARFQEGKRKFDEWERQNEIGRKVLASLRTAWLVEEKRYVGCFV
jgi:hypothetical protein